MPVSSMSKDNVYFVLRFALPARLVERFLRLMERFLRLALIVAISPFLCGSHQSVELYRYRGAARDGGTLEYVFEADPANLPQTVAKEKVAEIAADAMTTFYGAQVGALETQELRTTPLPFWLCCFSDTIKGPLRHLFFVVVLPDGTVVEPRVSKRL